MREDKPTTTMDEVLKEEEEKAQAMLEKQCCEPNIDDCEITITEAQGCCDPDNSCCQNAVVHEEITFDTPTLRDDPLVLDDDATEIPRVIITVGGSDYLFVPKSPTNIESLALSTFLLMFTVHVMAGNDLQSTWDMMSAGLKRHFDRIN